MGSRGEGVLIEGTYPYGPPKCSGQEKRENQQRRLSRSKQSKKRAGSVVS